MTPSVATIGVLALQGAVREHETILQGMGVRTRRVKAPAELDGLDGLVLPGGESTAMARLARPSGLLTAVRDRLDAGLAVLATCAGLILLADAVADPAGLVGLPTVGGLDVTVRRNAYGAQLASGEAEVELLDAARATMTGVFIRAPRIERLGAGVSVVGAVSDEPVAVRAGNVLACSFHPELVPDPTLHKLWLEGAGLG